MLRIMRFRSRQRDAESDALRDGAVRQQIELALASIDREIVGVTKRLAEASDWAGSLMGNEDGIYSEREPADEERLQEAERSMKVAELRIGELRRRREVFERMLAMIDDLAATAS